MSHPRNELTKYLRSQKITYTTFPAHLSFQNLHLFFNDDDEYITIRAAGRGHISMSFPYASLNTMLKKIYNYREFVKLYCKSMNDITLQVLRSKL